MSDLSVTFEKGVCQIAITRAAKRNTISAENCAEIVRILLQAQRDSQVHCLVLRGDGAIFCAGADLGEILHRTEQTQAAYDALIEALIAFDKPLLAAVNGPAVGLGVALLQYCDLVYCGEKSLFSLPFTALGLAPEYGLSYLASSRAGLRKISEKLLLSEPISAQEALSMGLVSAVFKDEDVVRETLSRAARLTQLPLGSLRATKKLLRQNQAASLRAAISLEKEVLAERLQSDEAQEACRAFSEGRKPNFSAR
ncbi:MAG TPA: enoyl-CoA hydratase/isomerase family protein [Candidatus Aphodousia gallistercoris]|nr:enoyl-CoA hydratase/isomerase family protein [Candidatus Aphodousia gallistercoris]